MAQKAGFVGLGQMGRWMARNLLLDGFDLTVLDADLSAVQFAVDQGAQAATTPAELASQVDWVFLCLPDAAAIEKVLFAEAGVINTAEPGLIVVDHGTTAYGRTLDIARRLREKGIRFADAPVSGTEIRAKDGTLTIMFGGEEALFEDIQPALNAIGKQIIYMGTEGSGQLAKLANQLLYNTCVAAMAEVLPMAAKLGLDPEKVLQVVTTGTGQSFAVEFFGPRILEGKFDEGYSLRNAYKDMVEVAEISAREKIPLPVVHAATVTYQLALADGLGEESKGAMIKVFERILGVQFRKREAG